MLMSDLLLYNANVITMDPSFPRAQSIAIQDGKISAVSESKFKNKSLNRKTVIINCKGKTVLPGWIDSHLHFYGLAETLVTLNVDSRNHIHSISDIQSLIRRASQNLPLGTWIRGKGYHEFYLIEKRHPTRWDLDAATSVHPIKLTHRSGHAHVLNSLALSLVGISKYTPDPPGGMIDRDLRTGEPTGILYGMSDHLSKLIPPVEQNQLELGVQLANQKLLSSGVTSIQDTTSHNNRERWEIFWSWKERNLLQPRVRMLLGRDGFDDYKNHPFPSYRERQELSVGGVKIIIHEVVGQVTPDQEELNELVLHIHQSGFQAVLHAVEEPTIEAACLAIEYALKRFPRPDHRHRIEHCAICPPPLAKRLASLGIVVVTQPSFLFYHGERYLRTVPESGLKHLYPLSTLIKNGVKVAGSSDSPVSPVNPLIGIYSSISRRAENGELVLPEEGISPLEAISLFTDKAAEASFEEKDKGSITPGKLADLIILNGDPTTAPLDEIKDFKVEMTILAGQVVWTT